MFFRQPQRAHTHSPNAESRGVRKNVSRCLRSIGIFVPQCFLGETVCRELFPRRERLEVGCGELFPRSCESNERSIGGKGKQKRQTVNRNFSLKSFLLLFQGVEEPPVRVKKKGATMMLHGHRLPFHQIACCW